MGSLALQDRIESILERHRDGVAPPSQRELNELYARGTAAVLTLETERLRVKRRMTAAAIDSPTDPEAAREADELAARSAELVEELDQLKRLVSELRLALEWSPRPDDELPQPPRRRFRRLGRD